MSRALLKTDMRNLAFCFQCTNFPHTNRERDRERERETDRQRKAYNTTQCFRARLHTAEQLFSQLGDLLGHPVAQSFPFYHQFIIAVVHEQQAVEITVPNMTNYRTCNVPVNSQQVHQVIVKAAQASTPRHMIGSRLWRGELG